ncbi:MAG TPA: polyhydroxyalkanoate synthesis regulator DNA-binding domain-containing protein [Thermoanaerobaculia bacterium]|nr:polyhydroxyalkanoate synthesis regulator DNA-binding domain-containing protein [Thermoanaerobaculia bacterium]
MTQPVVVRKYENRRLYDTSSSRYVNLPEIAQLIREGTEVQVVDAKSGDDITAVILTQIIHEDARAKRGDLPIPFLRELVVASDRAFRDFVVWYADAALSAQRGAKEAFPPLAHVLPFLERTLEGLKVKAAPAAKPEPADDVAVLKERIAELEARLGAARPPRRTAPAAASAARRGGRRATPRRG